MRLNSHRIRLFYFIDIMSKNDRKKPVSFRIHPELYKKFRDYCDNTNIAQTELFETWIELLNTDKSYNLEPTSLMKLSKRVRSIEEKIFAEKVHEAPKAIVKNSFKNSNNTQNIKEVKNEG